MGGDQTTGVGEASARLSAFVDSNVLIRHLTGDPPDQAKRATIFLREAEDLILVDLVVAEVVYVLESVYEVERERVAELVRAILGFSAVVVPDRPLLLRALEIYEQDSIHFAESYLAACAEASGVGAVASFDRTIDRVTTVRRLEPSGQGRL
jgi:predicted nucleic-acid-binding protein